MIIVTGAGYPRIHKAMARFAAAARICGGTGSCPRMRALAAFSLVLLTGVSLSVAQRTSHPARLIIVDPGHFHATLLQKEMYPSLDQRVSVYAPLGPELLDYLNRISLFNTRKENPTHWDLDIHTGRDPMADMLRNPPGNVVVFTGRNRGKIDRILASLSAGLNVFADKPWIIASADMPKLEQALDLADRKGLVAYDIMTERYEVTSELQRLFVNDAAVFGRLESGSADNPAVRAKSIHNIRKVVAGVPLRRPAWFFDVEEYGEGLADVGTHVVDLVQWTAFPDQPIDYRKDIRVIDGHRRPLPITPAQFRQVTGEPDFPASLAPQVRDGKLEYFCNNSVHYTLRGVHVNLDILWNWEAPEGAGDSYESVFRGSKARVELRQGKRENNRPELYIVPSSAAGRDEVFSALQNKTAALQSRWPGLAMTRTDNEARLVIPEKFRVGHEEHFAQVANRYFDYLRDPKQLPAWERPNMLAKYYVSTHGVESGRRQ
jgi:predicted dehydrogenase